jgi:hypothetical protein
MVYVEIWHNEARDAQGRHPGFDGYRPSHAKSLRRVFTYDDVIPVSGDPLSVCYRAFSVFNAPPDALNGPDRALMASYRMERLRSLSVGDVLVLQVAGGQRVAYAVSPHSGFAQLRADPTRR